MEDQTKQVIAYLHTHSDVIPVDVALAWFEEHIAQRCRANRVLLDARVSYQLGKNINWQIELLFGIDRKRCRKGFFACHTNKHFTGYRITLGDRVFWFDEFETALNFLNFEEGRE